MPWLTRLMLLHIQVKTFRLFQRQSISSECGKNLGGIRWQESLTTMRGVVPHWLFFGKPTNSTSEDSTDADAVKDYGTESTWYTWFDDNLDDYYTVDVSESSKTIDPSQLINTLLDNQVTL